jgi:hypothetical protein
MERIHETRYTASEVGDKFQFICPKILTQHSLRRKATGATNAVGVMAKLREMKNSM